MKENKSCVNFNYNSMIISEKTLVFMLQVWILCVEDTAY